MISIDKNSINYPSLEEIKEYFTKLEGKVIFDDRNPYFLYVTWIPKEPIKVVDWDKQYGDGIAINSYTGTCFTKTDMYVGKLPKPNDSQLTIRLQLFGYNNTKTEFLNELMTDIEMFPKTWYYWFKAVREF